MNVQCVSIHLVSGIGLKGGWLIQDMSWNGFKKERYLHPLTHIWKLLWLLCSALMKTDIFSQWPGFPLAIMITIQPYYVTDRSRRLPLNENTISRTPRWPQFGNIYDMSYCHNRLNSNIQCNLSSQPSLFFNTNISDNGVEFLSNVYSDLE